MSSSGAIDEAFDESIYNLSCECEESFDAQVACFAKASAIRSLLEEYQQRFAIWTANIGVFARQSQSLDRRLMKAPDVRDLVLRLLDILRGALQQVEANRNEGETHNLESRLFVEAIEAIEESINRLNHLGSIIRQASKGKFAGRVSRFASTLQLGPFENLCAITIQKLYPDANEILRNRLSKYMSDQFAATLFSRSRQSTLQTRRQGPEEPTLAPSLFTIHEARELQPEGGGDSRTRQFTPDGPPLSGNQYPMHAQSDLSSLDTKLIRSMMRKSGTVDSGIRKTSSIHMGQLKYPPRPSTRHDRKYVTCDWCSRQLMDSISDNDWRRHVKEDFKPYICLSEDCSPESTSYTTFHAWYRHMNHKHGDQWHVDLFKPSLWVCIICESNDDTFANSQSLFDHMETVHIDSFTIDELRAISLQSNVHVARPHGQCLLCSCSVDRLQARSELAPSEQRKEPLQRNNKASRLSTGIGFLGPRIADDEAFPHLDPQIKSLRGWGTAADQVNPKRIAQHIGEHLQIIMLLTMRLASLQNLTEDNAHDEIRSQTVETDGDNTSQDLDLSDNFGVDAQENTYVMDDDMNIDAPREDNEETTGYDMDSVGDWGHVPLLGQVPVEQDRFLQTAAMSGAFQATQKGLSRGDSPLNVCNSQDEPSKLDWKIHHAALTGDGLPSNWNTGPTSRSMSSHASIVATAGDLLGRERILSPMMLDPSRVATSPYPNQYIFGTEEQEQLALSSLDFEGNNALNIEGNQALLMPIEDILLSNMHGGIEQESEWDPEMDT